MKTGLYIGVGDLVWWRHNFGKDPVALARIERIELVKPGQRDGGDSVMRAEWTPDRTLIVDLTNGHWAYGHQICPLEGVP